MRHDSRYCDLILYMIDIKITKKQKSTQKRLTINHEITFRLFKEPYPNL